MQQQRYQQPPDTTVSVEERIDRFGLHVGKGGRYQYGIRCRLVKRALERRYQVVDDRGRWRHEVRVAGPGAADPVLRPSELAGLRLASAAAREQLFVHLANQAIRQREAAADERSIANFVIDGLDVSRHDSLADAISSLEGIDVADGIPRLFDSQGRRIYLRTEGVRTKASTTPTRG
jgi:hypothetical protein